MLTTFDEADPNYFPIVAALPQVTVVNPQGTVAATDLSNNGVKRSLIKCENCSKNFSKRMHYKYKTASTGRSYYVLMSLVVIAKSMIDRTIVRSVLKLLHYEPISIVI